MNIPSGMALQAGNEGRGADLLRLSSGSLGSFCAFRYSEYSSVQRGSSSGMCSSFAILPLTMDSSRDGSSGVSQTICRVPFSLTTIRPVSAINSRCVPRYCALQAFSCDSDPVSPEAVCPPMTR